MIRPLLALFLLCLPSLAHAASFSTSYTDWVVKGADIRLNVALPAEEAQRAIRPEPITPENVAQYVGAHVAVHSAGGDCTLVDQGLGIGTVDILLANPDLYRFEMFFKCPSSSSIVIQNRMLFALAPAHIDFARIGTVQKIFLAERQSIPLAAYGMRSDGLTDYIPIGFAHVWRHLDHICFLAGLLFILKGRRDYIFAGLGLALGYVLSGLVAASGQIMPDPVASEALSGLALLLMAVEIIVAQTRARRTVAAAAFIGIFLVALLPLARLDWRVGTMLTGCALFAASYAFIAPRVANKPILHLVPTALFAMLDGLSFLPAAAPASLNLGGLIPMIAGFDIGAWFEAVLVLSLLFGALKIAKFLRLGGLQPLWRDLGAAAITGVGLFWMAADFWG